MSYLVILLIIVASIPAFYVASRKDFIIINNKKYNTFLLRFLTIYPFIIGFSLSIIVPTYLFFEYLLRDSIIFEEYGFLKYTVLLIPIFSNILINFVFKRYVFKRKIIREFATIEDRLFVYFPNEAIFGRKLIGTKYHYPKRKQGELLIGHQVTDLILDTTEINKKIAYTEAGELIVNEHVLSIFKEQNLTGFTTRSVQYKGKKPSGEKHHQILVTNIMPPISPLTQIKKSSISLTIIARDYELYYKQSDLQNQNDFNVGMEYFGANNGNPYFPQRYWIVSPKVKNLFIQQLGQKEQDFIPVIIIKDEEPQSDFETDE